MDNNTLKIGVLALQGAFAEHKNSLNVAFDELNKSGKLSCSCQLDVIEVRTKSDILGLNGLVIPGGESTTMAKFLERGNFVETIQQWRKGENNRKPMIWGTCAGLILLANTLHEQKTGGQVTLGGIDITASRNLYGRQKESFVTPLNITHDDVRNSLQGQGSDQCDGVFIRAPGIKTIDAESVQVLAQGNIYKDGTANSPVAVKQGNIMVTAFHPELTKDYRWHAYFITLLINHDNTL